MKTTAVLILFSVIALPGFSHSQGWQWQNPLPQGNDLNVVHFVDDKNGWIMPVSSLLIRTQNGGQTWETIQTGLFLRAIDFTTPQIGWAIGRQELSNPSFEVYHTKDGGQSWQLQLNENVEQNVFFLDSLTGWVPDCQKIFHTNDGGDTWSVQAENPFGWGSTCLDGVFFKDATHGWAYAGSWGIATVDGGENWESVSYLNGTRKIVFADSSHGWLISFRRVKRTIDGGQNWEPIYTFMSEDDDNGIEDLVVFDRSNLLITTAEGVYVSSDGGFTWEQISDLPLGSIAFIDRLTAWAVGPGFRHDPAMYKTTDGGCTWQTDFQNIVPTKTAFFVDVDFVDPQIGWVIGHTGRLGPQYILKTVNGGQTWEELPVPTNERLQATQFLDEQLGWLIGNAGTVFHTADGGYHWMDLSINTLADLHTVHFSDSLKGWAVGGIFDLHDGTTWRTEDGGQTWVDFSPQDMKFAVGGDFVDLEHGWVVTGGGRTTDVGSIWHTSDGGLTWEQQLSDNPELDFWAIRFPDITKGWAIGADQKHGRLIYATKDGGQVWDIQTLLNFGPRDLSVFEQNVWVVGTLGNIISTDDSGQTWTLATSPVAHQLSAIDFVDKKTGWTVGTRSIILHTKKDDPTVVEENNHPQIGPKTFRLLPSYPNPFTLTTHISFYLNVAPARVTVTIYDILGREVRVIEYLAQNQQDHKIVWDGRDNFGNPKASGIYLYRVQTRQEWLTGKPILTK